MSCRSWLVGPACAFAWFVLPAFAGPNTECPRLPTDLNVFPGQELRFGDNVFLVSAYLRLRMPPGESPEVSEGGNAVQRLQVDLFARPMDPVSREGRAGAWIPGLRVQYSLRTDSGGELSAGLLDLHLTQQGPAYGASIPVPADPGAMALDLSLSPSWGGTPEPHHDPEHGECPSLPGKIQVLLDRLAYGEEPWSGGETLSSGGPGVRMNLLSSLDPRPADNYSNIWGWDNGQTFIAVIGCTTGTVFINVTNPFNAVEVGFIDGPDSSWREIKAYGNYIYIVTEGSGPGQGLQIVDMSAPTSPTLVNTYAITFATAHTLFIDTVRGHAYINGTNNGMRLLDLANPVNPVEIGSWTQRYVHDSYAKDGIACFSEIYAGLQELLDVSNPASLQILSSWTTPGAFTHNCWANDAYTLLVTTDENNPGGHLTVYDVSQKTAPGVLLSQYQPNPNSTGHNAYWEPRDNERVAMSHYGLGAKYIDLHRPTAPVELGSYDTYPSGTTGYIGAWGMYNRDPRGYLYVSDIQTGFYLLEYAPTGGTLSGVVRDGVTSGPVSGAKVIVLSDGAQTMSGADGVYGVYAPQGSVQVRVSAPGYRSQVVLAGTMPLDGRVDRDVTLERLPRVPLSGTVKRSDTLAPIAGATVKIVGTSLAATTASDGTYAFAEVAIGQQTVTAEAWGFSSGEERTVLAEGGGATLDLELEPGRFVDDAETDRGWTLGNVSGDTATSGRWERVDPNGTGGGTVQPEDDHTPQPGVTAFITGQSPPGAGNEVNDVDGGVTTLLTPVLNGSGLGAARIGYHRWLSNNAGFFSGGQLVAQVSSDNGSSWTTLETQASNANAWTRRDFDVGSYVPLTNQLRVRFRAEATAMPQFSVLEAGIDDFELVRTCLARFNPTAADGDGDGVVNPCDACPLDSADDVDADGICGNADNAPFVVNPGQQDGDVDGVGDAADNCVAAANADQRDLDGDGLGDACDGDVDGDGLDDSVDGDRDNDTVPDLSDRCPTVPDLLQLDHDGDGTGDLCDPDDGEVQGLRLFHARVSWEPEQGSTAYNLYRGDLGGEALQHLAVCRIAGVVTLYYEDPDLPVPGDGFFYLVSRKAGAVEGTLGYKSSGAARQVDSPCP